MSANFVEELARAPGRLLIAGAPEGADAQALARAIAARGGVALHIARDARRAAAFAEAMRFFAPGLSLASFPAWDCLPYDRMSPSADIVSQRMAALALLAGRRGDGPLLISATVNAACQRTPPREMIAQSTFSARPGQIVDIDQLTQYLIENGFTRAGTVREAGEFAIRGGLIDIFPPGAPQPYRLDFFGDALESVRRFDPESQLSSQQCQQIDLSPVSEILLTREAASRFRRGYVARFGAATDDDPLYEAVSNLRKHQGMEHWAPLFYARMETLFDYLPADAMIVLDYQAEEAFEERAKAIADYYNARAEDWSGGDKRPKGQFAAPSYKPLPADELYIPLSDWNDAIARFASRAISPFAPLDGERALDIGARRGRNFVAERSARDVNVFDSVVGHARALMAAGKRVAFAAWTEGAAERMAGVLADHGLGGVAAAADWRALEGLPKDLPARIILGLEHGFETDELAIIAEQDILGDRLARRAKKRRAENFLAEASALAQGDLVVHVDHGVGRYAGLRTLTIQDAPHDCLELHYAGGDKLFLPVENIELLSRYGSEEAALDKLGGAGWQARKSRLKQRLKDMAEKLIKIAAARELRRAAPVAPPDGAYDEFCARFPYAETEDQEAAIEDVLGDLQKPRPMDRLICGDVGFGKTEIALRAAFLVAATGRQVALIAPTTLLARQHYETFRERFKGFPMNVVRLSRLVAAGEASQAREDLASGRADIVIGTHALLSPRVAFRDLGLVVVDEEQHFGVKHKERLKELRADTHVLTLTATPIPRTLQLAMSGLRDLSIIATPPVDRLAVRTSVGPFDPVVVREALLRERYRGGQSFYVCPRIADLADVSAFLSDYVGEVKTVAAHGRLAPQALEDIMTAFYDGQYDVLLSTSIVESGLDIPRANTLIIHRADMFGLAQLYQIRGRIGRSKQRAYALLTLPPKKTITPASEKRLKVLQSLDTLGAGFTLASHDLDIRGGGNLLGEEQSGHVREVGVELYQQMLEEAVASLREGGAEADDKWSPQINIGAAVLIPDSYIQDLDVRLGLYRRLSDIADKTDIDAFAAEMIDRFGALPQEVEHLLKIVEIKGLCRRANVAKIDAGPKGAVVTFRKDDFANPAGLVELVTQSPYELKLRPDQKLVQTAAWPGETQRLKGVRRLLELLIDIVENP